MSNDPELDAFNKRIGPVWQVIGVDVWLPGSREPLLKIDDLKPGTRVEMSGLCGDVITMVVSDLDGINGHAAASEHMGGFLEFAQDVRKCWVCTSLYNLAALKSLNFD